MFALGSAGAGRRPAQRGRRARAAQDACASRSPPPRPAATAGAPSACTVETGRVTSREAGGVEDELFIGTPARVAAEVRPHDRRRSDHVPGRHRRARRGGEGGASSRGAPQRAAPPAAHAHGRLHAADQVHGRPGAPPQARAGHVLPHGLGPTVGRAAHAARARGHQRQPAHLGQRARAGAVELDRRDDRDPPGALAHAAHRRGRPRAACHRAAARRRLDRQAARPPAHGHRLGARPPLRRAPARAALGGVDGLRRARARALRRSTRTWTPRRWRPCPSRRSR